MCVFLRVMKIVCFTELMLCFMHGCPIGSSDIVFVYAACWGAI